MALFKISKGASQNLPSTLTEGYCWYTYNDSKFYIDFKDENGVLTRKALNAKEAEKLTGYNIATILNSSNVEIPTSKAVLDALANKADKTHDHNDKYYTESEIDSKLATKANTTDIPDALSDLASDATHRTVTDAEKSTWNAKSNFSGNYNDLTNKPTIPSISGLATQAYVDDVASTKVNKVDGKGLSTNDYTTTEKNKLSGIATGAEVNQNAFSNIVVGSTTIVADSKTDSLTIAAGTGVSVSADATNDKVTITNSGVRSVATGANNGAISVDINGTITDVAVKGLGSAAYTNSTAYDASGSAKAVSDALGEHTKNTDIHVTTTNKTNWGTAYNHSQSAHARVDATKVADSNTNGNILINDAEVNVYSHPASGVSAGTYRSVTVNAQGHVTTGSNPTTLSGYGITDAETKSDASKKLTEAKQYADNAATKVKDDLLNGAGEAYDTLKELGALIDDNKDAIDALEDVASGKAAKEHTHAIADVNGLKSALDGKAETSHGTHVTYSTTAPVMDGTASVGSAATVARSDHKHPTDTSRASQTSLDTHTSNKTVHVTANNENNWNTAYTHSTSTHARTDATKVADSTTNGNILINGTETNVYSHPNSGVTAGTYKSVTVNAQGHITAGTNPTTLAGYGITDAETKGAAAIALTSAKEYTDYHTSLCAPLGLVVADDSSISDYSHLEDFILNHAEVMVPDGSTIVNLVATLTEAFEPFNKTGTLFLTINKVDASCQDLIINATLHSAGEMPTQYVCSRSNGEWTSWDLAGNTKLDQHMADSNWKKIYDSGVINSKVNSFMGIDVTGYKKLKVAIKCVNTTASAGTSAVEVAFVGEGYVHYYFSNLFPSLITSGTSTSSAMAEFAMADGFVFCDNVLKSSTANNMFSNGEGMGVWNMTSLGGGVMTCNSPFFSMDVAAANDSMDHYFGAGSRVIVWGCKA